MACQLGVKSNRAIYIYIYIYICAHHLSGGIIAVAYSSVPLAHECRPVDLGTRSY